jgi:hypothetical protein
MTTPRTRVRRPDLEDDTVPVEAPVEAPVPAFYGAASAEQVGALWSETPEDEIHYRPAMGRNNQPVMRDGAPLMLAYVTARYVQDRLDTTVGAGAWQSKFESLETGAVRCGIGILVARGDIIAEWIWKWDVGTPSSVEPDKGAHSDAFKRAAVQWGVARDLYDDRDESAPLTPQPVQAAPTTPARNVRQAIYADAPPAPVQASTDGVPAWACPIHNDVQTIPAGTSKRTGRAYPAFYACPVPGCDETANIPQ